MSISLAPVLGVMVTVALLLMLPALDGLGHPNRWWAPVTVLVLASGFLATGVVRAGAAADRPAPSTLLYLLDRDAGTSRWASADDHGLAWARERTGTALDDAGDLEAFGRGGAWRVSPAPAIDAPPPSVSVRSDTTIDGRRRVELASATPLGAESVTFELPATSPWRFTALNGRDIPAGRDASASDESGTRTVEHWGVPADTLTLTLSAGGGEPLPSFWIVEQLLRPGALLGPDAFRRPDTLMPSMRRRSDRALIRTPVILGPTTQPMLRTDSTAAPVPSAADTAARAGGGGGGS
jgi:hypothetical protein